MPTEPKVKLGKPVRVPPIDKQAVKDINAAAQRKMKFRDRLVPVRKDI